MCYFAYQESRYEGEDDDLGVSPVLASGPEGGQTRREQGAEERAQKYHLQHHVPVCQGIWEREKGNGQMSTWEMGS